MKKRICLILSLCLVIMLCSPIGSTHAAVNFKLNAVTRTLNGVGKKCTLKLVSPAKAKTTWKSSNKSIATVNSKGVVTAKKKGTVTITCTAKYGSTTQKLTCKVTVKVPATGIHFTNAIINEEYDAHVIELGSTYDFNAVRISSSPYSAPTDVIRFYVKDPKKATVDPKKGIVTPLKKGYTTLTVCCGSTATKAKDPNNTKKETINLYITKPSVEVTDCQLTSAHELTFTFSHAMDASTLITDSKLSSAVSVKPNSDAKELGKLTASLSEDGKKLIVTSENAFDGSYSISVGKTATSAKGFALTPFSESKILKDTVGPSFLGSTVDDTGLIVSLQFNEPISIDNLLPQDVKRSDGAAVSYKAPFLTKSNYSLSEDKKSILLDLSSILPSDQNIGFNLTLYGITDLANNPSNPYPLVAPVYTNTTTSAQAELQNIYRNGNSIVAVFNKTMKTPGYMLANNIYQSGEVNKANKKEVIYYLTEQSLLDTKTSIMVTLYNFSSYNASGNTAQMQRMVNFGAAANLPRIEESSFTTKKVNSVATTVLTLIYNKNVTLLSKSGYLSGRSSLDGVIGAETLYAYTATAEGKTVTITFNETFTELATYSFTIPANLITDSYHNNNGIQNITVTKLTGESSALPAPSSIQIGGNANQYIYVTFATMLDLATAQDRSNYSISGVTVQSAQLIANNYNSPSIVQLTVAQSSIIAGAPYQVKISGIKGYKGSYTTMATYQTMITLSNNQTLEPIITSATSSASSGTTTVTITFRTLLVSTTPTNIDYTATMSGTKLKIKNVSVVGNDVVITFEDKIPAGKTITLTPGVNNYLVDVNNSRILNTPISVIVR